MDGKVQDLFRSIQESSPSSFVGSLHAERYANGVREKATQILTLLKMSSDLVSSESSRESFRDPSSFQSVSECFQAVKKIAAGHQAVVTGDSQSVATALAASENIILVSDRLVELLTNESQLSGDPSSDQQLKPQEVSRSKAAEFERQLSELQSQHQEKDHPHVAVALSSLGQAYLEEAQLHKAQQFLEDAWRMHTRLVGDVDDSRVADTLHSLGLVKQRLGDLKVAQKHLEESLRMKRSLSEDDPNVAGTLQALGELSQQTGNLKKSLEYLQESLRLSQALNSEPDHPRTANILHSLGDVTARTGDLKQGIEFLKESLRMQRALHGNSDRSGIAATLQKLGDVVSQTGDLKQAMLHLIESLRMQRSLHGDLPHPGIAVTLQKLGDVTVQKGDLKEGMLLLQESLRMQKALSGYPRTITPGIVATLQKLGDAAIKVQDLKKGIEYLKESLEMQKALHGGRDHAGTASTLHKLGEITAQSGDLKQSMQFLQESLRMQRSLHGGRDHLGIAITLHKLGDVAVQSENLKQGVQFYEESLRMQRSLFGDSPHPGIAATLRNLGDVTAQTDVQQGMGYLQESLQVLRTLHGDKNHASVAATLHALGVANQRAGNFDKAEEFLKESLKMKQSLFGDQNQKHPSLNLTSHLIEQFRDTPQILEMFKAIQEHAQCATANPGGEDPEAMSNQASKIAELVQEIGSKLKSSEVVSQDSFRQQDKPDNVGAIFGQILAEASEMSKLDAASNKVHTTWASACARMLSASEKAQEMLQPRVATIHNFWLILLAAFDLPLQLSDKHDDVSYDIINFAWTQAGLLRQTAHKILKLNGARPAPHLEVKNLQEVKASSLTSGEVIEKVSKISNTIKEVAEDMICKPSYNCVAACNAIIKETWNLEDVLLAFAWPSRKMDVQDLIISSFREVGELALECESRTDGDSGEDSNSEAGQTALDIRRIQQVLQKLLKHLGDSSLGQVGKSEDAEVSLVSALGIILDGADRALLLLPSSPRVSDFVSACQEILDTTHRIEELLNLRPKENPVEAHPPGADSAEGGEPSLSSQKPTWSYNIKVGIKTNGVITAEYVYERPEDCVAKYLQWTPDGHIYYHLWIQTKICLHHVQGTCVKKDSCKWLHPKYNKILEALVNLTSEGTGKDRWQNQYAGPSQ